MSPDATALKAALDDAAAGRYTAAWFDLAADIDAFGEPDWLVWDGDGLPVLHHDAITGDQVVLTPVLRGSDVLRKPLRLQWSGDQSTVAAALRQHALPFLEPRHPGHCFQILPASRD